MQFTSIDPLCEKYYSISPYAFCADNPLKFFDLDGRKLYYANNATIEFKKEFVQVAKYLNAHVAGKILKGLIDNKRVVYLKEGKGASHFDPNTNTITWDPHMGMITDKGVIVSPTVVVNHEMDHALDALSNPNHKENAKSGTDKQYGSKEEKRVITGSEQDTARKLNEIKPTEVTRTDHEGQAITTTSPVSTTPA